MQSEAPALTHEDWRELARRVQQENDPEEMMELVYELLAKLDEEKLWRSPRLPNRCTIALLLRAFL